SQEQPAASNCSLIPNSCPSYFERKIQPVKTSVQRYYSRTDLSCLGHLGVSSTVMVGTTCQRTDLNPLPSPTATTANTVTVIRSTRFSILSASLSSSPTGLRPQKSFLIMESSWQRRRRNSA